MKFLLVTLGSVGDILPFLGVAETLRQRRHRVIIASNAGYGTLVRASGFEFAAIWQRAQQSLDGLIDQDPAGAWAAVQITGQHGFQRKDFLHEPFIDWLLRQNLVLPPIY
jgi:hypothetical protein